MSSLDAPPIPLPVLRQAPRAPRAWDGRSIGGSLGHRIFLASIAALGRWPTYALLALVVPYYCLIARRQRRASRDYLDRVLGPAPFFRRLARTYRHFYAFGESLVDRFVFYAHGDRSFSYSGEWENVERALAAGKGAIFLSAHVGGWQIAASVRRRFSSRRTLPTMLNIILHVPEGQNVPSYVQILEREGDIRVISLRDAANLPFEVVAALERGEIVAVNGDRLTSDARVAVDFFGSKASFPIGPWQIAAATGAPVVPVFMVKESASRYRFLTHPPIAVALAKRSERDKELAEHVRAYARILEDTVRAHPYQWFNFFEFWRA